MKINGKSIEGPKPEVIVIPKGDEQFVFKAMPVLCYDEFLAIYPQPLPMTVTKPGKAPYADVNDKAYLDDIADWVNKKSSWMMIESLKATEGLEWDTVVAEEPETWSNWRSELEKVFTDIEMMYIIEIIQSACGLNQNKISEATEAFLASEAEEHTAALCPSTEPSDTQNG